MLLHSTEEEAEAEMKQEGDMTCLCPLRLSKKILLCINVPILFWEEDSQGNLWEFSQGSWIDLHSSLKVLFPQYIN